MTLAIQWRPSNQLSARLDILSPSSFLDVMQESGYHLPCTVDSADRPVMHAMAVLFDKLTRESNSPSLAPNPFKQIVELLDLHDAIDLDTII